MNTEFNADANRDPDRLAQEIDEQRREINETLRALEEKFSSREIANQFMQYVGGPGREWVGTLSGSVKANPLPTLLTAIGVSWLMMSDRRGAPRSAYYGDYAGSGDDYGRSRFRDAADSARDATDAMMRKAHELGDRAEHAGDVLGERAAHAREALHSHASHTRDALRSQAAHARDSLRHAADLRYNVAHVIKEQPLALGAIGIAIGALLGAALPRTEPERRVLGEASERVMEKGREMAREGYAQASRKVSEVVEAAEEALDASSESTEGDLGGASLSDIQPASSTSQGPRAPVPGGTGLG